MIINILQGISVFASIMLCIFVAFFQIGKSSGLNAISGEGLSLFEKTKVRGAEKTIQNFVLFFTIVLFACIILIPLVSRYIVK